MGSLQQLHFSGNGMYLEHGFHSNKLIHITIRSIVELWLDLGLDTLAVLNMNCEGCEYEVIAAMSDADLLNRVDMIIIQAHTVLDSNEVLEAYSAGLCSAETGRCVTAAAVLLYGAYARSSVCSRAHIDVCLVYHFMHSRFGKLRI